MKKIIAVLILAAMVFCLTGCQEEGPVDPLVAKWVLKYDEDRAQVMFSFEDIGDLEVVIWEYSEATGELEQTEKHVGTYIKDAINSKITYELDGQTYVFGYHLEDKTALTLEIGDKTLVVPFVMDNSGE